jgi:ChrR Cupin-like domain
LSVWPEHAFDNDRSIDSLEPHPSIMKHRNEPLTTTPAPDPVDPELAPLLGEPFASALAEAAPQTQSTLGARLAERAAASRAAASRMVTKRRSRLEPHSPSPGVRLSALYAADASREPRPGEPLRAWLVELEPGASWAGPDAASHREWLVMRGGLRIGTQWLAERDYHVAPEGSPAQTLHSDEGALVFLRESAVPAAEHDAAFSVFDRDAGWPHFVPGIQRRVLWQRDGQAAMLYYAQPGAQVPLHTHGHDEECLMVQGELFLDDVLLKAGDYQLAPAGTHHSITETDTGVVIYAHGDLDLNFVAEPRGAT